MMSIRYSIITILLLLFAASARAQSIPQITQSVVAGGGGTSASSPLQVEGTAGQSVTEKSSGGSFQLESGFWATVNFNSTEVNDTPTATNDGLSSVAEDSGQRTISIASLLTNDMAGPADESRQTLVLAGVSNPTGGTVTSDAMNVYFIPTANYHGPASFQYTVTDNGMTDGAADPQTSAPATVSFTITEVNDTPVANNNTLTNILEDSGARVIPFADLTGNDATGPANEASQSLIVKAVSNPVGGTIAINGINVEFTPTADFNGVASFDYTVEDDGTTNGVTDQLTSAAATASFNIEAVNDAPSFTNGADQVASGVNPQTVTNWAANILAGPPDEAGQTVAFNITNNTNPGLFSSQPSIDPSGTLTYTPNFGINGTATITVELKDNGGTAKGGQDTSAQQTFMITISSVGWTTTGDSGVTEDESNPARPTYTNFTASANAGSPVGSYVLRYNITSSGDLTAVGATNTRLRVRFRDDGEGSRVIVAIVRASIMGGAPATLGTLFDSNAFTPGSGFQTQEVVMPAITFDFTQNIYWLEVILTKDTMSNQPGFGSAQIK